MTSGTAGMAGCLHRYCAAVLTAYAKKLDFTPVRRPNTVEMNCEDDLYRHYNRDGHLLQCAPAQVNNKICFDRN